MEEIVVAGRDLVWKCWQLSVGRGGDGEGVNFLVFLESVKN